MSGYIKHFKDGNSNMFFMAKDNGIIEVYDRIWDSYYLVDEWEKSFNCVGAR